MFEELLRDWDGEEVVARFDPPTGAWLLIGVHSTVLGPAMGGTRMKPYPSPEDALRDVLRLSGAMTVKQAVAELPFGGGKAVLAVPEVPARGSSERRALLHRYAAMVESLHGTYVTAADMNTDQRDMDVVSERTRHVLGRSQVNGGSGDPAPGTAIGVFHGIRSSCRHVFGSDDLSGRSVLVQGVGSVGSRLVELLREHGAEVAVADVDGARAAEVADANGARTVDPEAAPAIACDVYSPCATGAVLTTTTIPSLACALVAGAANNQLGEDGDAKLLRERGILYAPDFVINAGGVIHLGGYEILGWDEDSMAARLAGIGDTLTRIYETADGEGVTTVDVARRMADARLDAAASPS